MDMSKRVEGLVQLAKAKSLMDEQAESSYRELVSEDWTDRNGARLCAKAWMEPDFKKLLFNDGRAAAASLGFSMPPHHARLAVKENTETLHNVICCTLCSCSAFTIMGVAPGWYKDLEYRARIVREAHTVLAELGLRLPPSMAIRVWDTTTDTRYMVLPARPAYTEGWVEDRLAELITKDALIGVARLEPVFSSVGTFASAGMRL